MTISHVGVEAGDTPSNAHDGTHTRVTKIVYFRAWPRVLAEIVAQTCGTNVRVCMWLMTIFTIFPESYANLKRGNHFQPELRPPTKKRLSTLCSATRGMLLSLGLPRTGSNLLYISTRRSHKTSLHSMYMPPTPSRKKEGPSAEFRNDDASPSVLKNIT